MPDTRVPVGILISGRGSNMAALIAAGSRPDCPYRVAIVASDNADAGGLASARAHGIAAYSVSPRGRSKAEYEADIDVALRGAGVRVIALAGYMRILSPDFVERWRGRILNIHPSLLPRYKGLDTHARAIAAGDDAGGCSVHVVTEALDDGEVLGQASVPILPGDTSAILAERVLVEEHRLYPRVLAAYARGMTDLLDRIRSLALQLPGAKEDEDGFLVEGACFAATHGDRLRVRGENGWEDVTLSGEVDWRLVEDRIARSWELVAPAGLLEAGGR